MNKRIKIILVLATNLALALSNWSNLGSPSLVSNGLYQFIDPQSTNLPARYTC